MSSDLYSKKYNIRFFHCPKCAMTSIRHSIHCEWTDTKYIPNDSKVLFVYRDILDRFVSSYFQIRKTYKTHQIKHLKKDFIREISDELVIKIKLNPNDYLNEIINNGFWDSHQLPQIHYANEILGRSYKKIDDLIMFEDIDGYLLNLGVEKKEKLNINKHPEKEEVLEFFKTKSKEINYLYKDDLVLKKILNEI